MSKVTIPLNGISTSSSYSDGDAFTLTNLRKKNGSLRPVTPRQPKYALFETWDELFIHQLPGTGQNWIGVKHIPAFDTNYPYQGTWSSITTYTVNQSVVFEGNYYYANATTTDECPSGLGNWTELTGGSIVGSNYVIHTDAAINLYYIPNIETNSKILRCAVSSIPTITQIGNVLNILDDSGLKHLIWYESNYVLIDSNFDGDQTTFNDPAGMIDLRVNGQTFTSDITSAQVRLYQTDNFFSYSSLSDSNTDDEKKKRADAAKGLIIKAISNLTKDGLISGFCLACTAIELFDGSYILQSRPVLMGQPFDILSRYSGISVDGQTCDYLNNQAVILEMRENQQAISGSVASVWDFVLDDPITFNVGPDGYSLWQANQLNNLFKKGSTDLIDAPNTAISTLLGNYVRNYSSGSVAGAPVTVSARYNKLQIRINQNIDPILAPIINSVSVFMTPQACMYKLLDQDLVTVVGDALIMQSGSDSTGIENYLPPIKTNAEIIKELVGMQFYKVLEIPFDDIVSETTTPTAGTIGMSLGKAPVIGAWTNIDMSDATNGILENLVQQDPLPVDNFTHHTLVPLSLYVYNSSLHALNYTTLLSRGFPLQYFYANQGAGQFPSSTWSAVNTHGCSNTWYVEVDIKTSSGISTVVRFFDGSTDSLNGSGLNCMLSYPDSRAKKIRFYQYLSDTGHYKSVYKEFALTASVSQNFAYYIDPNLMPIDLTPLMGGVTYAIPSEVSRAQVFSNGMKVSDLNDPFNFPLANTYLIGTGKLLAACSNASRMSEGQFGQFPLYVSASDGIYALNVGTESAYTNTSLVSNEVPVNEVLYPAPFGVIFIGKRGLYVLNGQLPDFISPGLEQPFLSLVFSPTFSSMATPVPLSVNVNIFSDSFITYLKDSIILFDFYQNEIIVSNSDRINYPYNYVYNLDSKMWYQSTEAFTDYVKNAYPELFVINGSTIKDFSVNKTTTIGSVITQDQAVVSILTRPFDFGMKEIKNLKRIILRGRMTNSSDVIVMDHSSNDGINFDILQGKNFTDFSRKDIDMRLMQCKKKQFLFIFSGTMDEESEISAIDCDVDKEYSNDKMR